MLVVDATMIGSGDLRLELGLPPTQDGPEPSYQACVQQVFKAAKANGDMPVFGFAFGPAFIESKVKQGYRGIMVTSDVTALVYKQMADLKLAREMIQQKEDTESMPTAKVDAMSLSDKDVK
jgi:2-keto-3-deoxy-L-rhamnonate aldolase RhmA